MPSRKTIVLGMGVAVLLSVSLASAIVGDVSANDHTDFRVTNAELIDETVSEGESTAVIATVENVGPLPRTDTIRLQVDGEVRAEKRIFLPRARSAELSFMISFDEAGSYDLAVNGVDAGTLTVEQEAVADIAVTGAALERDEIRENESVEVTASVENSGGDSGSQTVRLLVDGNVEDETEVTVAPNASETVTFTFDPPDAGEYNVSVNGVSAGTVTVETASGPAETSSASVTSASLSTDSIRVGESITVAATVENPGAQRAEHTLVLYLDGEGVDTRSIGLNPGEIRRVNFTRTFDEPGEYDLAVDNATAGVLTVRDVNSTENGSQPPSESQNSTNATDDNTNNNATDDNTNNNATDDNTNNNATDDNTTPPDNSTTDETVSEPGNSTDDSPISDNATEDNSTSQETPSEVGNTTDGNTTDNTSESSEPENSGSSNAGGSDSSNTGSSGSSNAGSSGSSNTGSSGSSSSSSSGGGSDTRDDTEPTVTRTDEAVTVRVDGSSGDGDVHSVDLAGPSEVDPAVSLSAVEVESTDGEQFEMTVSRPTDNAVESSAVPHGDVLAYVELGTDLEANGTANLSFEVDPDAIPDGLERGDVRVMRYDDGEWTTVGVTQELEGEEHHASLSEMSSIAVVATEPGSVEVVETSGLVDWVRTGHETTVSATVQNPGDRAANRTLTIATDGDTVAERAVSLDPSETATVEITFEPTDSGTVTLDGTELGTLSVGEGDPASAPETMEEMHGFGPITVVFALLVSILIARIRRS